MEHTQIVTVSELEQYAQRTDSRAVIPELVYLLIRASLHDIQECRIPYGDAVNQPGWDGLLDVAIAFRHFVPKDISYWEIGTGGKPGEKATDDFKKRTRAMSLARRAVATYVFVTPRGAGAGGWPEPAQTRWKQRREKFGWRRINILDGHKLADWLREFPALGVWLAKKIGTLNVSTALSTPATHWGRLRAMVPESEAKHFHKIFLVGRERACEQLHRLFSGDINQLLLAIESVEDADDFVAAFLESLDEETRQRYCNLCLFIKDADAWLSFSNLRRAHILVANPKLDVDSGTELLTAARQQQHRVIIPISGRWANGSESVTPLRSPSKAVLESVLRENGLESGRVRELASVGALSLSALKRHLLGLGDLPPYATWPNANILAMAGLAGSWQGENPNDKKVLELLLGKPYGEWIEGARELALMADTPLFQRNEKWKIISRGEAWTALGPRLANADLERFKQLALEVLREIDPKFELPPDEHYLADVRGKSLLHSSTLRDGIAESLALMGSRADALSTCTRGKAEYIASSVVRELLEGVDWCRWASLNNQLPMLAEASPEAFLKVLEDALIEPANSPFCSLFPLEGNGITGGNYMTGLLWALESLAWHPDHLTRVTLILGDLASIDPGGNWENRPSNSLHHIFLPWFPQTAAPIASRILAIEALVGEQPETAWRTLLTLLPTGYGTSSGTHRPVWRRFIPDDRKETVLVSDYNGQVVRYAQLTVELAAGNVVRLAQLIDHLPNLPNPAHISVLEHLRSAKVVSLPDEDRFSIWESLMDLCNKHKKYANADWAMPAEIVSNIEEVVVILMPHDDVLLHRRLFSERDFDLYETQGNFEQQQSLLDSKRTQAIVDIFNSKGLDGVLKVVAKADSPRKVGQALGNFAAEEVDLALLPIYLEFSDSNFKPFIDAFVWSRYWHQKWVWVDTQLAKSWAIKNKVAFLVLLPFSNETWQRVERHLGVDSQSYWKMTPVNAWNLERGDIILAANKLIEVDRADGALESLFILVQKKIHFPPELAVKALLQAVERINAKNSQINQFQIQELIAWLQNNIALEAPELFQVEWAYFPLLDHRFGGGRAKALEYSVANDAGFFCQLIAATFRSDKADQEKEKQVAESDRNIARQAYSLIDRCQTVAGTTSDGVFSAERFALWLTAVKEIAAQTGHLDIAMDQCGKILSNAPADPNGLWIHSAIATALNAKDAAIMRSGFTIALYNSRGVHGYTHGVAEKKLAVQYCRKADALSNSGFPRLADAVRELGKGYDRDAEREKEGMPFDD